MNHNILLLKFLEKSCHFFGKGFFTNSLTQKWLIDFSLIPRLFQTYSSLLGICPGAPLVSVGSSLPTIFRNKLEQAKQRFKGRTCFLLHLGSFNLEGFRLGIVIDPDLKISQHTHAFIMKVFTLQNSIFH